MAGMNDGLRGSTADALAHFSVIATKGTIVLSDLQGEFIDLILQLLNSLTKYLLISAMRTVPPVERNNHQVHSLFDPMTHT